MNNRPNPTVELVIEGRPPLLPGERQSCNQMVISPGYFATIGVALLRGRDFDDRDGGDGRPVAIIGETAARRYWPNEDPLGQRVRRVTPGGDDSWLTVVGIADDVKQGWFDKEMRPQLYLPHRQAPALTMSFLLRAAAVDPLSLVPAARAQILAIDPVQPLDDVKTLERLVADETSPFRFAAVLMLAFGIMALALSAVGVFSVMSFSVAHRTREIGVRIALGARRGDILRLILVQGLRAAALGLAVGLPVAFWLSRLMAGVLFGVVALEYLVLGGFVIVLGAVAGLASSVPAWRASTIDPILALRHE